MNNNEDIGANRPVGLPAFFIGGSIQYIDAIGIIKSQEHGLKANAVLL